MCGRAKLPNDYSEIKIKLRFDALAPAPNLRATWNLAPTQPMLTAILNDGKRWPVLMRWGLLPSWAKDEKLSYSTFNARADGVDTKPAFRGAWKAGRRCLIVTGGFYEWRKPDKQPFAIEQPGGLTIMAGLWDEWISQQSGEVIRSCTIITTDANDQMAELHDRMPVILGEKDWPAWLGEEPASQAELKALLVPYAGDLQIWPVGKAVGNVRNDGAELAVPVSRLLDH